MDRNIEMEMMRENIPVLSSEEIHTKFCKNIHSEIKEENNAIVCIDDFGRLAIYVDGPTSEIFIGIEENDFDKLQIDTAPFAG